MFQIPSGSPAPGLGSSVGQHPCGQHPLPHSSQPPGQPLSGPVCVPHVCKYILHDSTCPLRHPFIHQTYNNDRYIVDHTVSKLSHESEPPVRSPVQSLPSFSSLLQVPLPQLIPHLDGQSLAPTLQRSRTLLFDLAGASQVRRGLRARRAFGVCSNAPSPPLQAATEKHERYWAAFEAGEIT